MRSKRSAKPRSRSTTPTFPKDWSEFLSLLIGHGVKFVVVGGHAVAIHGWPRLTEDLDVFVEASDANAQRLRAALVDFGFGSAAPEATVLAAPDRVFMLGVKPLRIDVLTGIDGVKFPEAWRARVYVASTAGELPVISLALLRKNKRAAGRTRDLLDLAELARRASKGR
jgi:hypothetical protein